MVRDNSGAVYRPIPGVKNNSHTQFWIRAPGATAARGPYKVTMLAVLCDEHVAQARALVREFQTGRHVPMSVVSRSHRIWPAHFLHYVSLVDEARLYDNTAHLACPALVASKAHAHLHLEVHRPDIFSKHRWRSE